MQSELAKLAAYAKSHDIRIYLTMVPDVHNLGSYDLGFAHERVRQIAVDRGYMFLDLLPAFGTLSPEQVWAMPGDPHPNALTLALLRAQDNGRAVLDLTVSNPTTAGIPYASDAITRSRGNIVEPCTTAAGLMPFTRTRGARETANSRMRWLTAALLTS